MTLQLCKYQVISQNAKDINLLKIVMHQDPKLWNYIYDM